MSSPLVVRIPEKQKLMLEIIASGKNVSVAQITRLAIKDYVAKTRGKRNLFAKLVAIGGSKKAPKAPRDLSEKYKSYLYGKNCS